MSWVIAVAFILLWQKEKQVLFITLGEVRKEQTLTSSMRFGLSWEKMRL